MQKLAFSPDRLLGNCNSWEHFWAAAASLSKKQKGDLLERLVQLYLLTKPKYRLNSTPFGSLGRKCPSMCASG
jgi:hypothetical protein